jgi:MFS family permease
MSWVPRFPEVKANLGMSNGEFGTLVSLGSIGSLVGQFVAGQFVHRFGALRILIGSSTIFYAGLILVVHSRENWQFLVSNLLIGMGMSSFHIALNGQALHVQESLGENLMPRLHGVWSIGALSTAVISGFLAGKVSVSLHITALALFNFIVSLYLLRNLTSTLLKAKGESPQDFPSRSIIRKSRGDWIIGVSFTCAIMLEVAVGDWAAIFSREELNMSPGVSAIPYIGLMTAMILGRLTVHKVLEHVTLATLVQRTVLFGGGVFILSIIFGVQISNSHPALGFALVVIGTVSAGLGASFLAPTIMSAANKRSKAPGAVVIAQLGAQNMMSVFLIKFVLAWTAELASIGIALLIPALMLMALYFMAHNIERTDT